MFGRKNLILKTRIKTLPLIRYKFEQNTNYIIANNASSHNTQAYLSLTNQPTEPFPSLKLKLRYQYFASKKLPPNLQEVKWGFQTIQGEKV